MLKLFASFLLSLLFISCASQSSSGLSEGLYGRQAKTDLTKNSGDPLSQDRIMVYDADVTLKTYQPDSIPKLLEKVAEMYDGYAVRLDNNRTVIKVKAEYLDDAIKEMSKIGDVEDVDVTGRDITAEFKDLKLRLDNKKKARKKYLEILDMAKTVEDILKVEKELERINIEIERIEGQIRLLENQIRYSKIEIYIVEKK